MRRFGLFAFVIFWTLLVGVCHVAPAAVAAPGAARPSQAEPFDYFRNSYNVIALKDYAFGARVTDENEILLDQLDAPKVRSVHSRYNGRLQVQFGRQLTPLTRMQTKTLLHGWMPIILLNAADGDVRYEFTLWASPLPSVKDWRKAFVWPTEGENFLVWIVVKATNTGGAPAEAKVRIVQVGSAARQRPLFSQKLAAGKSARGVWRTPFQPMKDGPSFDGQDPDVWLKRTVEWWRGLMDGAARIDVPCRKATDALLAAHVCQLIASDRSKLHAGEGFYDRFYPRDAAYQVMQLEEAGLMDMARKVMAAYLACQLPDGRFHYNMSPGQLDANGQSVWTLWQFYKITGDRKWLADVYPRMRRAADWTIQACGKAPAESPFAGVLGPGEADGECLWGGKHHIVGYDLWNLRAVLCAADAARILGKNKEADGLLEKAKEYRAAIDAAWKRTELAHFPPSWEKAGTHWGNTETLWPTELFARDDSRVAALIGHVRKDFGGGYIEGTIQWRGRGRAGPIHPYMGAYTTMADLVRGRHEQVVEDFYWYLLHSTASHAFPEGIYYKGRFAWNHTIPHPTGASNYALMLRHMLVHEEADELHLLCAVPDWWLGEGRKIRIERAPTHFGVLGLTVRGTAKGVEVTFDPPKRRPPKRVVIHLPKSRPLLKPLKNVEVALRSAQKKRWDFATVVALYKKSAVPITYALPKRGKPDTVSLTTGKAATCSYALPRYPAYLANDGCTRDTRAYWATESPWDKGAWWQVDLAKPTTVGRVVVIGYYGGKRFYGFTVKTSLDGKQWDLVADLRKNKEPSTAAGYTCRFTPRPVRYLRVTMTHNSANTARHLVEVMAFEK